MTRRDRPTPEEAFADYLALGPERSIAKLCELYADTCASPPALRTLKNWSAEGAWRHRVVEHAAQVGALVQSMAAESGSQAHLDMARSLHAAGNQMIAKIVAMVEGIQGGDVAQANVITDIALKLSKHALEIERGRPPSTERLREIMDSIPKPEGDKGGDVTELPAGGTPTAPPQSTDSILRQFDAITGADKGKPH
jgi:hypothetical protein